jgi:hypothetical protein
VKMERRSTRNTSVNYENLDAWVENAHAPSEDQKFEPVVADIKYGGDPHYCLRSLATGKFCSFNTEHVTCMNNECGFDEVVKVETSLRWKPGTAFRAVTNKKYLAAASATDAYVVSAVASGDALDWLASMRVVCATPAPTPPSSLPKPGSRPFYNNEAGYYIVSGNAGSSLLQLADVHRTDHSLVDTEGNIKKDKIDSAKRMIADSLLKQDPVYGDFCGYRFPGRVQKFGDDKWMYPGGESVADVCFGSSGSPGGEGPAPRNECWLTVEVPVINCGDFYLHELPAITDHELRVKTAGKLYVKIASMSFNRMHDDDWIPKCNPTRVKKVTMRDYHMMLCKKYGFGVGHNSGTYASEFSCNNAHELDIAAEMIQMSVANNPDELKYIQMFGKQIERYYNCELSVTVLS